MLLSLAVHAQQNDERLTRIERRLDELVEVVGLELPTHEDLSAVRIHSARVAAEVARVGAELARGDGGSAGPDRPPRDADPGVRRREPT